MTNDKYSFTLASSCIGKFVDKPVLSNDKKTLSLKALSNNKLTSLQEKKALELILDKVILHVFHVYINQAL